MEKVVIITNHSYMLYQFRRELISELLKNHEVVLVMPFVGHEDNLEKMGCRCIHTNMNRRGMNPFNDTMLLLNYETILKQEKPDLVITYSIKPNIYGGIAAEQLNIPYCTNVQGLGTAFENKELASFVTFLYRKALKKAKTVFFENQENANEFISRKIIDENQVKVLNGAGVNLERYQLTEYPSDEQVHFIFVGRIMKEKGIDEIISTAKKMKKLYQDKVVFDFVGFFEEEYKQKFDQLVQQGIVVFHGFQQDVRPYIEKAHCLLLPSYHEGMANTILEASSMARPVIVSNIPGCKEGVFDQKTGYLVKVKDSHDLFEKVNQFYQLSCNDKKQMGLNARQLMEDKFNKHSVVEATMDALMRAKL